MNAGFLLSFALSIKKELTLAGEHTIYNFTVLALRFNLRRIHFHAIVLRFFTLTMSDSLPLFLQKILRMQQVASRHGRTLSLFPMGSR